MTTNTIVLVVLLVTLIGVNTLFWGGVGIARAIAERAEGRHGVPPVTSRSITTNRVAVLIAAHDEELVIASTLRSAATQVPPGQIFVASDGSTDRTSAIATDFGAQVLDISPNRGKARAIVAAVEHFALAKRFDVVVLLDADTVLSANYLASGLALFRRRGVVAVAGRAATRAARSAPTTIGRMVVAYRDRVYLVMQYVFKYGQATKGLDAVMIVPGFASMYRTGILSSIDITAPGLVIEDYNMTFEVHAKRLGRVAFHPRAAVAFTQDPSTLGDYSRQVARWSLGFWQTLFRHRLRPSFFAVAVGAYTVEIVIGNVVLVLAIPAMVVSATATVVAGSGSTWSESAAGLTAVLPLWLIVVGVWAPDYVATVVLAIARRRPGLLLLGLMFPLMRVLDAVITLWQLPRALAGRSNGVWTSPPRRIAVAASEI